MSKNALLTLKLGAAIWISDKANFKARKIIRDKEGYHIIRNQSSKKTCVQLLSHIWLFVTPWTIAHQTLLVHGIFQARILEWVAISFSRGSSRSRDQTCISCISCIAGRFFTTEPPRKPPRRHQFSLVQSLSCFWLFVTPWTAARQARKHNNHWWLHTYKQKVKIHEANTDRVTGINK